MKLVRNTGYILMQGSTPLHRFTLPAALRAVVPAEVYLTYSQRDRVVLEKTLTGDELALSNGVVTAEFTRAETYMFSPNFDILAQIQFMTGDGRCYVSHLLKMGIKASLKRGGA